MNDNDMRYKIAIDCISSAADLVRFASVLLSGVDLDAVDKTQLCSMLNNAVSFATDRNSDIAK